MPQDLLHWLNLQSLKSHNEITQITILFWQDSYFFLIDVGTSVIVVQAQESIQKTETIISRADIIEWRYKIVNGVLYRRQYNTSNGQWIGSWEPF